MKKLIVLAACVFSILLLPFAAQVNATPFAEGVANLSYYSANTNATIWNGSIYKTATYYTDYELTISGIADPYSVYNGLHEAFCVEWTDGANLNPAYLHSLSDVEGKYRQAAYLIDHYYGAYSKSVVQVAVWEAVFDAGNIDLGSGFFKYNSGLGDIEALVEGWLNDPNLNGDLSAYGNWVLVSDETPWESGAEGNQDFIIKPKAVPEPATMMLLGFGLIGLTLVGGRRFIK